MCDELEKFRYFEDLKTIRLGIVTVALAIALCNVTKTICSTILKIHEIQRPITQPIEAKKSAPKSVTRIKVDVQ